MYSYLLNIYKSTYNHTLTDKHVLIRFQAVSFLYRAQGILINIHL